MSNQNNFIWNRNSVIFTASLSKGWRKLGQLFSFFEMLLFTGAFQRTKKANELKRESQWRNSRVFFHSNSFSPGNTLCNLSRYSVVKLRWSRACSDLSVSSRKPKLSRVKQQSFRANQSVGGLHVSAINVRSLVLDPTEKLYLYFTLSYNIQ